MITKYNKIMEGVRDAVSMPRSGRGVVGLLSRPEAEWLSRIPKVIGPGLYGELGTFRGLSACLLAGSMRDSKLITVDLFTQQHVTRRFRLKGDVFTDVKNTFKARGFDSCIEMVRSRTAEAAPLFGDGSFIFLFIDADHSYEGVRSDFEAWQSKLQPDGIIAFHDSHKEAIIKFHSEIVDWEEFDRVETLSVWKRK